MPTPERHETARLGVRWRVRFRQDGVHRSRTFATKPEAQQFCDEVTAIGVERAVSELDRSADLAEEPTLDEWAERHFASLTSVTPGTLVTYRRVYARTWHLSLGHYRLSQLTRETIAKALLEVPGADKSVKNAWGVLTFMLKVAVQDGHLSKSPTAGIKLPQRTAHLKAEHRYLTHAEFWQVMEDTPVYWRPLVAMLGGTGMRWGEAAALLVSDVDTRQRIVRVTKAEKWDASTSTRAVGATKTRAGRRTITLPDEVLDAIAPVLQGRKGSERLFLPPKGGPLRHMTFYRDIWRRKSTVNLDDPKPRIHDLRHSQVAWLIAAGAPLPVIKQRLGHEKITTTIDTYGHLLPDLQRAAADAAGMVFSRPTPELE